MPHENAQRAARYRERAHALRSIADETENLSARTALKGVAADYNVMAQKLETNGFGAETAPPAKHQFPAISSRR